MSKKWQKTSFEAATRQSKIDRENGIIHDVVMCQVGEAKGHGVQMEQEFIDELVKLANKQNHGVKARFGHPTMSTEALGTGLGRYKNARVRGSQAIADLHLAEYSKNSPDGDLHTYILDRAEEDPESFGSSIVFKRGESYQRDEKGKKIPRYVKDKEGFKKPNPAWNYKKPIYQTIKQLLGCDLVDTPAATESLFHSKYNSHAFAVRITEFLDQNEDIFQFLDAHPDVEGKVTEFLTKYRKYKSIQTDTAMDEKKKDLFKQGIAFFQKALGADTAPEKTSEEATPEQEALQAEQTKVAALEKENAELKSQIEADKARFEQQQKQLDDLAKEVEELGEKPATKPATTTETDDLTNDEDADGYLNKYHDPVTEEARKRFPAKVKA